MMIEELEAANRVLVDRLIDCKASNRSLSQKCKALVKSKGVRLVPRVCAFCEHYKVKRSETIGQGAGFPITVVSCDNLGYGVLADPLLSCPKFKMKKLGMKEEEK